MSASTQKTLLLVEDEVLIAQSEKLQLEKYGYAVRLAASGEKAVEAIKASPELDLVLMDINLGRGMDGTEAAGIILQDHEIPIVFLSSHSEREVVEKTEKITSYGYVVKNSSITVLDASIKMAFKLFQARLSEKKGKEILRQSEERYRLLFQNMNTCNSLYEVVSDQDGRICDFRFRMVNTAYEDFVGKKESDLVGRTLLEVFPATEPYWIDRMAEVARTGTPCTFENFSQILGTYIELNLFRPQDGQLAMIATNITDRKRVEKKLRESEEKHRQISENIKEVLWLTSADRTVMQYINPAYEGIWGRSCQSLYDNPKSFMDSVHQEDKAVVISHYEKFRRGECFVLEYRIVRPDSGIRWVKVETFPVRDDEGKVVGDAGIAMDITEQKIAQEKVLRHQKLLGEINRIGRLASSSLDLDTVLRLILDQTVQAQGASAGMIFLNDPASGTLGWGASIGLSEAFVREFQESPIRLGEGLTGTIAQERRPIFIAKDSSCDPRIARPVIQQEGLNSFIGVPLLADDEVVGVMNILTRPPAQLTEEDAGFISAIGLQVGWAIKNSRLHARTSTER
jgi:PAS domain S-box-containing protein